MARSCVLALALVAGLAAPTTAAASWSVPTALTGPPLRTVSPAAALGPNGDALVAWYETSDDVNDYAAYRAMIRRGGRWTAPFNACDPLSGMAGQDSGFDAAPGVAFNAKGAAVVLCHSWGVHVITLFAPGASTGTRIVAPGGAYGYGFAPEHVFLDDTGAITVFWDDRDGAYASTKPADGAWSPTERFDNPTGRFLQPGFAVGPEGSAVVAFNAYDEEYAATRTGHGTFGPLHQLNGDQALEPGGAGGYPQAAVDAHGNATVMWSECREDYTCDVRIADHPTGGSWTSAATVGRDVYGAYGMAEAADGTLAILYGGHEHRSDSSYEPRFATLRIRDASGRWGPDEAWQSTLPDPYDSFHLAMAADHTLHVGWRAYEFRDGTDPETAYDSAAYVATRTPQGVWHDGRLSSIETNTWPGAVAAAPDGSAGLFVYPKSRPQQDFHLELSENTADNPLPSSTASPVPTASTPKPPEPTGQDVPSSRVPAPSSPTGVEFSPPSVGSALARLTARTVASELARGARAAARRLRRGHVAVLQLSAAVPSPARIRLLARAGTTGRWRLVTSVGVSAGARTVRIGVQPACRRMRALPFRVALRVLVTLGGHQASTDS